MNRRTLYIALTAALVSLVLGYGLLGLAAPDTGGGPSAATGSLDLAALAETFTGPDGVPPRIVIVEETAPSTAANARRGDDDDRYDDDRYDDDRYDDDRYDDDRYDDDRDDDHDGRWGDDDD